MITAQATDILRHANEKLRAAIERLHPEKHCGLMPPDDLSDLLLELVRAGKCLRELQAQGNWIAHTDTARPGSPSAADLERERCEYQNNLETLWRLLPDFHRRALAERARLVAAGEHLDSAAAWASTNRRTF